VPVKANVRVQLHSRRAAPSVTNDMQAVERRIEQAMREIDGNKSHAATRLGLTRTHLYMRLGKYDLERPSAA
jgi:DNA-binding NtrC family response regulator